MAALITKIRKWSPAHRAGIRAGEKLCAIDGHPIRDVLDYKFYSYEAETLFELVDKEGCEKKVFVRKAEGQDAGLTFETYLMDRARRCSNNCVFCFIDQLPPNMRESLYFKDDDARMSFLLGNYISMTNLSEDDVTRMIRMHVSPVNISVQTMNPELRNRMLGNPRAGESLRIMDRFAQAGITMNCQVVVCPGLNDGEELKKTLDKLIAMAPAVGSVSVVPVGLTKHREGLYPLKPVDKAAAEKILSIACEAGLRSLEMTGLRRIYPSDELFLRAEQTLPPAEFYEEFPQLENGVGMLRLLEQEFSNALKRRSAAEVRPFTLVTGRAAAPFLAQMIDGMKIKCHNIRYHIYAVPNHFFGETVDVAGLLTGRDLADYLEDKPLDERVLLPATMLRYGEDRFLDDMHLPELARRLGRPVIPVETDGEALARALFEDEGAE